MKKFKITILNDSTVSEKTKSNIAFVEITTDNGILEAQVAKGYTKLSKPAKKGDVHFLETEMSFTVSPSNEQITLYQGTPKEQQIFPDWIVAK